LRYSIFNVLGVSKVSPLARRLYAASQVRRNIGIFSCIPRIPSFITLIYFAVTSEIFSRDRVTVPWFGLVIVFTELIQFVTAGKHFAFALPRTLQITIVHTKSSLSVTVFISRCVVATPTAKVLLPLASHPFPGQLTLPHSNSLMKLN
jgi:hypothetical protein